MTSIGHNAFYGVLNVSYNGSMSDAPWGALTYNGYVEDGIVYENQTKTTVLKCHKFKTEVTLPNSVTIIGDSAFERTDLKSITMPIGVTSIGNNAFYLCTGLTSVVIPNGVTNIGNYAFRLCLKLNSVAIPSSVTSIGDGAFRDCSTLSIITSLRMIEPSITSSTFNGVASGGNLYVPKNSYYSTWMNQSSYYLGFRHWTVEYI